MEQCGLFIDTSQFFLGASPDGLVGNDSIIEIKCPKLISKMHPIDGIRTKVLKGYTLDENNQLNLKTNHNYYYQVQGQLHITQRKMCYFILWSPLGMLTQKVKFCFN